ncbi:MAG: hypothetical protein RLY70_921 [Planctomycetota bacterium]
MSRAAVRAPQRASDNPDRDQDDGGNGSGVGDGGDGSGVRDGGGVGGSSVSGGGGGDTGGVAAGHRRRVLAALLLTALLAIALRMPLAGEPLWVDELHTSWVVGQGSERLAENARAGNQAPLWFYLPWLATRGSSVDGAVSATTPWRLRLPSLIAGLAVPLLTYAAARRLTGLVGPAWFAATLAALDPRFAFYATEARAYATVQVLALLHLIAWLAMRMPVAKTDPAYGGMVSRPSSTAANAADASLSNTAGRGWFHGWFWRAIWMATGGLLFYAHYTTALLLVAEALADFGGVAIAAARRRRSVSSATDDRPSRAEMQSALPELPSRVAERFGRLMDYGLLLAIGLPAVPHLNAVASHRADWSRTLSADDPWTLFDWYGLAIAPLAVVAAITLQRAWSGRRPWIRRVEPTVAWPLALMILLPWLMAWAATACDAAQVLRYRYLIGSATILPMVAAMALAALPRRAAQAVLVTIVLTIVVARHDMLRPWLETGEWPRQRDERWPSLVERVNGLLAEKNVPVLLLPALVEDHRLKADEGGDSLGARERLVRFCRFPLDAYAASLPSEATIIPLATLASPRLDPATVEQLRRRGGGLIVVRGDDELAVYLVRQLTGELARQGIRMASATPEPHGTLRLIAFTARPLATPNPAR